MNFSDETVVCRLCLKKFTENCAPIEEGVQLTLNFLTLHPNLTISDNPMMCRTCAANLTKCFNFKVRCLSTVNCIASFVEGEDKKVDLRDIYSKVKLDGNTDRIPDCHRVCRLCLELVKDDISISVRHNVDLIEILQKYFLEMDLKITDDIIACTPCHDSLRFYASFVNNYISIEERIEEYCKVEGLNYKCQVELRDVETFVSKRLLNVEDMSSLINEEQLEGIVNTNADIKVKIEDLMDVEQEEKFVVKEVQQESSNSIQDHLSPSQSVEKPQISIAKPAKFTCETCGYQNSCRDHLQQHILTHKAAVQVASEICPFRMKEKLMKHMLRHKQDSVHKCDQCYFNTKVKSTLISHMLTHKTPSEVTTYICYQCGHESRRKSNLKKHMLIHKSPSEITMYECETCAYKTKYKNHLQQHVLTHKSISEIKMHKCEFCPFETKWKNYLHLHLLKHPEVQNCQ